MKFPDTALEMGQGVLYNCELLASVTLPSGLTEIPEEMFSFNPWLMLAKKAEREGDMGKKEYYISKFFELFPAFAGNKKTKYWRGHRAVLL